ncbi:MAG: acyltransferase [Betaproteobacteria bacterium]
MTQVPTVPDSNSAQHYLVREAALASRADQFSAGLTGIRALAALMVLAHHIFALAGPRLLAFHIPLPGHDVQITWHWLITCSWMGANLFFVLSGFLLAIPYAKQIEGIGPPVATGAYLLRRIRRVVPAYWVQIVILAVVLYFASGMLSLAMLASHFVFLHTLRVDYASALNGVYWTLPVEFGYYLLLPLFAALALSAGRHARSAWLALCVALIAGAIAYRTLMFGVVAQEPIGMRVFILMQLPGLIDHFAIGMLLAWVYVRHPGHLSNRASNMLVLVGLGGIVAMMALLDHEFETYWEGHILLFVGYSITAIFMGLLVLGTAAAGRLSRALFANSAMLYVGLISYSLYLWHLPIIHWTMRALDRFGVTGDRLWWLVAITVPASLLVASASYFLVERPFLRRRKSVN